MVEKMTLVQRAGIAWRVLRARAGQQQPQQLSQIGQAILGGIYPSGGAYTKRGTAEVLKAFGEMPWLRTASSRVATSVASTPWELYVHRGAGGKSVRNKKVQRAAHQYRRKMVKALRKSGDVQEITEHPFLDSLHYGCGELDGRAVFDVTQKHLDLVGECFWLAERGPLNIPVGWWPLPPHYIRELPTARQPFYRVQIGTWTDNIPVTEMVYYRNPDPLLPYGRGSGIGSTLADEFETDEAASQHTKAWFTNRARPDILVLGKFGRDETRRLEREWVQNHAGFWQNFKPRFMGGVNASDIQVKELTQRFEGMAVTDLRRFLRDITLQVWGVPPEVFGIIENSNRSTIDSSFFLYMILTVVPRLELLRATMQERIIPMFDDRLILEYADPVPENQEFKLKAMQAATWAYDADEWREIAGEEPMPNDAGKFYMQPAMLIASRTPGGAMDIGMPGAGAGAELPAAQPTADVGAGNAEPALPEEDINPDAAMPPGGKSAQHIKGVDEPARVSPSLQYFEDCAPPALDEIAAMGAGRRIGTKGEEPPSGLLASDVHYIADAADPLALSAHLSPLAADIVNTFGMAALEEADLGIRFDLANPKVVDFLRNDSATRIRGLVNETTRDSLRGTLADGVASGDSMDLLQTRIEDVFDAARGYRSHLIARTETVRAANFGALNAVEQAGVQFVQWLATRNSNNRETHAPGAGLDEQVVPTGTPFTSPSGAKALHPGGFGVAAEDCNCQCRVIPFFGKSVTERAKQAMWKSWELQRAPYETRYRASLRRGFTDQQRAVIERLRRAAANRR